MAETNQNADPEYRETRAPQNPPNSIVNRAARTTWWGSSVGIVAIVFLIVAAGFFWVLVERQLGRGCRTPDSETIGTSGRQGIRGDRPGGFDPVPRPDSTRDELEFRGLGEPAQGPMPGVNDGYLTDPGALKNAAEGSRVRLMNVEVERADGDTFWIRAADTSLPVIAPGGSPTVRGGQQINVTGTIENAGDTKRIRATRIDVR
jgi:hypothetical protein